MFNVKITTAILLLWMFYSLLSSALPQYESTILPLPERMEEGEQAIAQEVLKLSVYRDSEDPDQYYFIPPFHVRQYTRGAASMVLHQYNIERFAEANQEIKKRAEYDLDKIAQMKVDVLDREQKLEKAHDDLAEALANGNAELIALRKKMLATKEKRLEEIIDRLEEAEATIQNGGSLLPDAFSRAFNHRVVNALAQAGVSIPYNRDDDPDEVFYRLEEVVGQFADSYGGYLSVNVYGGFSKAQLKALTQYKTKYMPHVKLSLMPVEKLSFFPLTEWQNEDGKQITTKMFRQINGAGGYLGAAIVLDTSIAGSLSLAQHLAPFILPIGIKATIKQQLKPTEAELICDFSNGYKIEGRADVRDGLVIYDNDITNKMKSNDVNEGNCHIKYISGDRNSAEFKALEAMRDEFEALRIKRTYLSRQEKMAYLNQVMDDIESNRRKVEPKYTRVMRTMNSWGWRSVVIEGLSRAADFHWHTNIQDVEEFSSVRFTKKISIRGHESIEKELPTSLCLVYNSALNAYDRCIEEEEIDANNISRSISEASASPHCQNIVDPFECGRLRDEAGATANRTPQPPPGDQGMPTTI
jgi:hypothetical protein